ncbi:MAG: ATP-binding protein [Pseudoclavibacter sp.]
MTTIRPEAPAAPSIYPGQWRLSEVQVANWGTFHGHIYRVPVARAGHLITGPSGSGKSSLLDAIAAVLTPDQWLHFNEAAQGAGARSDRRSLVSYIRGAWSRTTDELTDRVIPNYLRPKATWSGIALRYEDALGHVVTLARAFFLRGSSTNPADIQDICLLVHESIDLRDLEPHVRTGIATREVQRIWPEATVTSNRSHRKFYARLRTVFGIPHETALQLLHRTQSAKNLGSLDQLFRDYMLEVPDTFEIAKNAVEQFGELRDAYDHVVRLRMQRDHLLLLRRASEQYDLSKSAADAAQLLDDSVIPYQQREWLRLSHDELDRLKERLVTLSAEVEHVQAAQQLATEDLDRAQRRQLELGGGEADHLRQQIEAARDDAQYATTRWNRLREQLLSVGIEQAPETAQTFAELKATIDRTLNEPIPSGANYEQQEALSAARRKTAGLEDEIQALRTSGTTVPSKLLAVRDELVRALGMRAAALPFVAETVEVRSEYREWTGAIERVLRSFALTLLVPSERLRDVRRWVDGNHLKTRLVFEEVGMDTPESGPIRTPHSLVGRVEVSEGRFGDWVSGQLAARFDYVCVDHPDELADHARAVTINGQMRTSRTRYEKDDRRLIDDRSTWVLGDRKSKLEALLADLSAAKEQQAEEESAVDRATRARDVELQRRTTLGNLRSITWNEIDRSSAQQHVSALEERLVALAQDHGELHDAIAQAQEARLLQKTRTDEVIELRAAERKAQDQADTLDADIRVREAEVEAGAIPRVPDGVCQALEGRFQKVQRPPSDCGVMRVSAMWRRSHRWVGFALVFPGAGVGAQHLGSSRRSPG